MKKKRKKDSISVSICQPFWNDKYNKNSRTVSFGVNICPKRLMVDELSRCSKQLGTNACFTCEFCDYSIEQDKVLEWSCTHWKKVADVTIVVKQKACRQ
jgi:hypothetical protein